MRRTIIHACLTLLAAVSLAPSVDGAGYWNVPSSFCQCMGYGWGGGYHAPLVLGPVTYEGWLAKNTVRLPYTPQPYPGGYGYSYPGGVYDGMFDAPTRLEREPSPHGEPLPPPSPTPAATRPRFHR